ncbi:aspartyl-tRNA synthetase, mitochondrial isoform X2 [Oratosquilla oratoria]
MGKFGVLRDSHGITQVLIPEEAKNMTKEMNETHFESYVEVYGCVAGRPEGQSNKNMATGDIEVVAENFKVLSASKKDLPFIIRNHNKPKEPLRLKYRYLDLRHADLQFHLSIRSRVAKKMRDYLQDIDDFLEVTTPTLSVNTPGGAQEFVVPTQHPGKFYSLVQSPQTYKQLLMIGGIEKYFQFAICYRDEGAKPDRQPEFMQVDIEMTNITREEIQKLVENLIHHSWPNHLPPISKVFPSMSYHEAMRTYGVDKPDTRFEWKLQEITPIMKRCGVRIIEKELHKVSHSVHAFVIPGGERHINSKIIKHWENLTQREYGMKSHSVIKIGSEDGLWRGPIAKNLPVETKMKLVSELDCSPGDVIVIAAGATDHVLKLLGRLRLEAAAVLEEAGIQVRDPQLFNFLWVIDFPLFELDPDSNSIVSVHHPFTLPHPEDEDLMYEDPTKARSLHYDLVLNGNEIGGGSIRIHDPEMQHYVLYEILKVDPDSFNFFIDALKCGTPPHGGIALGFDRLITILCGAASIRDVIAFPKSSEGRCLMSGAPAGITQEEKELYHILSKESCSEDTKDKAERTSESILNEVFEK